MIIYVPGEKGNDRGCHSTVELIDCFATMAEPCGLPLPLDPEGANLKSLLDDPDQTRTGVAVMKVVRKNNRPVRKEIHG